MGAKLCPSGTALGLYSAQWYDVHSMGRPASGKNNKNFGKNSDAI